MEWRTRKDGRKYKAHNNKKITGLTDSKINNITLPKSSSIFGGKTRAENEKEFLEDPYDYRKYVLGIGSDSSDPDRDLIDPLWEKAHLAYHDNGKMRSREEIIQITKQLKEKRNDSKINNVKKITCDLCGMSFSDDLKNRKKRHEEFHSKARIQKRNTTNGTVRWIE